MNATVLPFTLDRSAMHDVPGETSPASTDSPRALPESPKYTPTCRATASSAPTWVTPSAVFSSAVADSVAVSHIEGSLVIHWPW